jgi:hypothetical protein
MTDYLTDYFLTDYFLTCDYSVTSDYSVTCHYSVTCDYSVTYYFLIELSTRWNMPHSPNFTCSRVDGHFVT